MEESTVRGIILKVLYNLDGVSSKFHRVDIVEILCGLSKKSVEIVLHEFIRAKLVDSELQSSCFQGHDMNAVKITQMGIDIVLGKQKPPMPISFDFPDDEIFPKDGLEIYEH
jgi:hypothetical protein